MSEPPPETGSPLPDPPSPNLNRVREHLANERTYLAWMRTAIALMGFGVLIVRLRYLLPAAHPGHSHGWQLGLLFTVVGLVTVLLATLSYFSVQRAIETETYEPDRRRVIAFTGAVLLIGLGVLYILFNSPPFPAAGALLLE